MKGDYESLVFQTHEILDVFFNNVTVVLSSGIFQYVSESDVP